jgi:glycosyltransferase involved in cell wall biosynthesis
MRELSLVMPAVTIAIPYHNPGRHFLTAVRSIFAQTFEDWELLLLDDGSTDESTSIAGEIRDSRVRVLRDGVRKGLAFRLNEAAALARGPLLARMDADDIMHPDRLHEQVRTLTSSCHPLVGSAAFIVDETDRVYGIRRLQRFKRPSEALTRVPFVHPSITGRTQWFQANPYETRFDRAEDLELWCRCAQFLNPVNIDTPLLFYREPLNRPIIPILQTYSTTIRIVHEYGPRHGNSISTMATALQVRGKMAFIKALDRAGLTRRYRIWRNSVPTFSEQRAATAALECVRQAKIPGVD